MMSYGKYYLVVVWQSSTHKIDKLFFLIGLGFQQGGRFIVLGHQSGHRDFLRKTLYTIAKIKSFNKVWDSKTDFYDGGVATSSPGRFYLALEVGQEKALASTGQSVILIGWLN